MPTTQPSRHRRQGAVLAAGAVGSLALALSMSGTLSAFSASITNSTNTAATGYLAMTETLLDSSGAATSTSCSSNDGSAASVGSNSATCATINKYGGTSTGLVPGGAANVTKISLKNTGTSRSSSIRTSRNVPATAFTLNPGACTATAQTTNGGATASTVCAKFTVSIVSGSTTLYSGTAAGLSANVDVLGKLGTSSLAAGASIPVTISVSLASSADNTYAGFQVSQPLAWTFNA